MLKNEVYAVMGHSTKNKKPQLLNLILWLLRKEPFLEFSERTAHRQNGSCAS